MNPEPTDTAIHLKRRGEQFDMNSVQLAGVIQKLWPRNGDVFARLRISTRGQLVEDDDAQAVYANVRFSQGLVDNQPVTLQPGDVIRVTGYLTHTEYYESIHRFLELAKARTFLQDVPPEDLSAWRAISFRRRNIMVNVRNLFEPAGNGELNQVILEGIVYMRWEYSTDAFARLAIYDRYAPIPNGQEGKRGRPVRRPHYINIRFAEGKVAGRPVSLAPKMRLRVTGSLGEKGVSITLHQSLLETGDEKVIAILGRLPNADKTHEIQIQQENLHVDAQALITFSSRHTADGVAA